MPETRLTLSLSKEAAERLKYPATIAELNRRLAREGLPQVIRVEPSGVEDDRT